MNYNLDETSIRITIIPGFVMKHQTKKNVVRTIIFALCIIASAAAAAFYGLVY
ncbi:hypothetical protein [Legionella pneumophila]|uniref:hypothetical protein n=1 Tax=Legionella pneumophila TaxID=446 RepID=UPI000AB8AFDF|nr:hypothetical protein [Legionella pneumophila]HDU8259161.1 hypothetical protein [Legionella pneumophila]